jgi:hypothetical protein
VPPAGEFRIRHVLRKDEQGALHSRAYEEHRVEFSQGRDVHEEIAPLLGAHHLVGDKEEMQEVTGAIS